MKRKPKPEVEVCPFTIIVEGRERAPYHFQNLPYHPENFLIPIMRSYLPTGDYAIRGHEEKVAIERKSLVDLYGTLGGGRERFEDELSRLNAMTLGAYVVIEATLSFIIKPDQSPEINGDWRSKMNPKSVFASIIAFQHRFRNVHWIFAGSARIGEVYTYTILERAWRDSISNTEVNNNGTGTDSEAR